MARSTWSGAVRLPRICARSTTTPAGASPKRTPGTTSRVSTRCRGCCARSRRRGMRCRSPAHPRRCADGSTMQPTTPMTADPRTELAALLEVTREIQSLIEAGEWLAAAQLDAERLARLSNLCAALEPGRCAPDLLEALAAIAQLNGCAIGAVEHQQRALLRDSEMLSAGRKAVAAYED